MTDTPTGNDHCLVHVSSPMLSSDVYPTILDYRLISGVKQSDTCMTSVMAHTVLSLILPSLSENIYTHKIASCA